MTIWESIFLGVLQGITEFLPVSSSGHLSVARNLLDIELPGVQFEVALHLATLISVLTVYRSSIKDIITGCCQGDSVTLGYLWMLVVVSIPAASIGLWGNAVLEKLFMNPWVPVIGFSLTGLVLSAINLRPAGRSVGRITVFTAMAVGLAQACALVPGISRSGMTVAAALWLGIDDEEALKFSFLASIPIILGATSLQLVDLRHQELDLNGINIFLGMVVASITGVLAIRCFLVVLQKKIIHRFAMYCLCLSASLAVYLTFSR